MHLKPVDRLRLQPIWLGASCQRPRGLAGGSARLRQDPEMLSRRRQHDLQDGGVGKAGRAAWGDQLVHDGRRCLHQRPRRLRSDLNLYWDVARADLDRHGDERHGADEAPEAQNDSGKNGKAMTSRGVRQQARC